MTALARSRYNQRRRTPTPESAVKRAILDGFAARRIPAYRMNTGAQVIDAGGEHQRFLSFGFPGCPDILVFWPGRGIGWVECKSARGTLSKTQAAFRDLCRAHGVLHVVARSWEDVAVWLHQGGQQCQT